MKKYSVFICLFLGKALFAQNESLETKLKKFNLDGKFYAEWIKDSSNCPRQREHNANSILKNKYVLGMTIEDTYLLFGKPFEIFRRQYPSEAFYMRYLVSAFCDSKGNVDLNKPLSVLVLKFKNQRLSSCLLETTCQ